MKKIYIASMLAAVAFQASPALAQSVIVDGTLPVTTYTQCQVGATYVVNPRAARISGGGWHIAPTGGDQWARTYTNGVYVASKHLRSLPYTYLEQNDGLTTPCPR